MKHQTKRQHNAPEICPKTKKVGFSESQASRRLGGEYEDIVRYYKCQHCPNYHITSQTIDETIKQDRLSHAEQNKLLKIRVKELENTVKQLKDAKQLQDNNK